MYQVTSSSKNLEMDSQIPFRIFPYRLHQLPGFDQHLIGIVEQCWVAKQLARGTFPGLQSISENRDLVHGVLQLSGKLFVFVIMPNAPLPAFTSSVSFLTLAIVSLALL